MPGELRLVILVVEDGILAETHSQDASHLLDEISFLPGKGEGNAEAGGAHEWNLDAMAASQQEGGKKTI